jgi:hypothetical protein
MSQLDDFIRDFTVKQDAIVAQYQKGINCLASDLKTLIREMLLAQKGLSVIEQGLITGKGTLVQPITDFTSAPNFTTTDSLSCWRIELKGAKKMRVSFPSFLANADLLDFSLAAGTMVFFSTNFSDTPLITDFAYFPSLKFSLTTSVNDYQISGISTVDWTTNTVTNETTGTITTPSTLIVSQGNDTNALAWGSGEIDCSTARYAYMIFPFFNADGFIQNDQNPLPTYQLLG